MSESVKFIYEKEFWFCSAFINSTKLKINEKLVEISNVLNKKLHSLTEEDLPGINWNKDWIAKVIEMGKNLTFSIKWEDYIESLPYQDENTMLRYTTLGYFQFEAEYYKDDEQKKEEILPILLQQIPIVVKKELIAFSQKKINEYILLDVESPIYIYVVSKKIEPKQIEWTRENIALHMKSIGQWTELYSGQWPDYNEVLYEKRSQDNLSNRLSELHYIRRNSGFIYMAEENYKLFFNSYMLHFVLIPTAQIRAILFSLISINESMDNLFIGSSSLENTNMGEIEEKIDNLKLLQGTLQTKMSLIYNELDYNRRQHYTSVLQFLIKEYNLDNALKRITNKLEAAISNLNRIYSKKNQETQEQSERGVFILQFFFGLGIVATAFQSVEPFIQGFSSNDITAIWTNGLTIVMIAAALAITVLYYFNIYRKNKVKLVKRTADAVIFDNQNRVLLINRKNPPFKGQLALPGGFLEKEENDREAIIREVKEETNLDILIEEEVGIYDKLGRDPRGPIVSTAFLCSIVAGSEELKGGDDAARAQFYPIESIIELDLAFDHEDILRDAYKLKKSKEDKDQ